MIPLEQVAVTYRDVSDPKEEDASTFVEAIYEYFTLTGDKAEIYTQFGKIVNEASKRHILLLIKDDRFKSFVKEHLLPITKL